MLADQLEISQKISCRRDADMHEQQTTQELQFNLQVKGNRKTESMQAHKNDSHCFIQKEPFENVKQRGPCSCKRPVISDIYDLDFPILHISLRWLSECHFRSKILPSSEIQRFHGYMLAEYCFISSLCLVF